MMTAVPEGALEGVRVVDLSRVLGMPYGVQVLGDHGADVIKVEPPQGDETRAWGPPFLTDDAGNRVSSAYFEGCNRNKRGMVLDLKKAEAREVLFRLLETADVLTENFKPGTMEGFGLGREVLEARFPRLVHARLTGFGADGPYGGLPGYDAVAQAMTGLMTTNGTPESGPHRVGVSIIDMAAGLYLIFAIAAALLKRERTGRGQFVEASLFDVGLSILHPAAANWLNGAMAPKLYGNAHPNITPYDLYPTATKPIFLGVGNDGQFRKLCAALGREAWAQDPRFASNAERTANRAALTALLLDALKDEDADALSLKLLKAGVPAGPMNTVADALAHAASGELGTLARVGDHVGPASPARLADNPARYRRPPPRFGEHTREILEEAGYSSAEIDGLLSRGAASAV